MEKVYQIIKTLRKECPWDRKQTIKTLIPQIIEETFELNSALNKGDLNEIKEELGDTLLTIFMASVILEERGIKFQEVLNLISKKMIKRHPHVFGEEKANSAEEVLKKWNKRKGGEPDVQKSLPALLRSSKIQQRASSLGFDWEDITGVFNKIEEELEELKNALTEDEKREELGDILFALTHLGNFLGVNPEIALQEANDKFIKRFKILREEIGEKNIKDYSIDELDRVWEKIKRKENK